MNNVIDVSRMIKRAIQGKIPTGIDRVCLEYVRHFQETSLAGVYVNQKLLILSKGFSENVYSELLKGVGSFKIKIFFYIFWIYSCFNCFSKKSHPQGVLINVAHSFLDQESYFNAAKKKGLQILVMIHDLIPITHPHFCRKQELNRHQKRIVNSICLADIIVTNSKQTLVELNLFADVHKLHLRCATSIDIASTRKKEQLCKDSKRK